MTEPQQKDYEELLEQLRKEEEICDSCQYRNTFVSHCDGCSTGDMIHSMSIKVLEMQNILC